MKKFGWIRVKDMKISQRLISGFSICAAITVLLSSIGLYGLYNMQSDMALMYDRRIATLPVISTTLTSLANMQMIVRDAVIHAQDPGALQKDQEQLKAYEKLYEENATGFIGGIATASWKEKLGNTEKFYDATYKPQVEQVFQLLQAGKAGEAANLIPQTD